MSGAGSDSQPRCWVLSDGKAGSETQSVALAEALDCEPDIKRLRVRAPWCWLPPGLWFSPLHALDPRGGRLGPPWPALLIASGRLTAAPARAVRRAGAGATFVVQILPPGIDPRHFDLVVTPEHDRLRGPNVLTTQGALTRVTPERLAAAAARLAPRLAHLPNPRVAVLIGGSSKAHRFTPRLAGRLARDLGGLVRGQGTGLMVTMSRRTGRAAAAALREGLEGLPAEVWDGSGENPYLGYLGLADAILVTADSVTMVSESASTGKPVHVIELEGGSAKFSRFHDAMWKAGITRRFAGHLETWRYQALDETARIAAAIRARLDW